MARVGSGYFSIGRSCRTAPTASRWLQLSLLAASDQVNRVRVCRGASPPGRSPGRRSARTLGWAGVSLIRLAQTRLEPALTPSLARSQSAAASVAVVGVGGGPVPRMRTNLLSKSNQKGAPSERAAAVSRSPTNFERMRRAWFGMSC